MLFLAEWSCRIFPAPFSRGLPTPPNQTKSIIRHLLNEAFNQGRLSVIDELVSPDTISHHSTWGIPSNRAGLKQWIALFRTAFPDLHCTIEDEIIQDDRVAAHWTMRGTHRGPFLGNPPTSRPVVVHGLIYARINKGQVIENWTMVDQLGVLQQLGLVPPPLPRRSLTKAES